MLGLFYLHKARKCLLIAVKQQVEVDQKVLGIKKNNKTRSPGTLLSSQIFKLCASSERQPCCWELELENGDLGLGFVSAFQSLQTLGKLRVAVRPALSPTPCFFFSDCTFLEVGTISSSGHSTESPSFIRIFQRELEVLYNLPQFLKSS